ncbi:xanthine dehydrogenase family protein molybdopterin-binding subunit [Urechidicola sp. KH5]
MEIKRNQNRRTFLKTSLISSGGLMFSFSWLQAQSRLFDTALEKEVVETKLSGYIVIKKDNTIIIYSQNPEIGQNIKTSMPMIVAEELDADWAFVEVHQADLDTDTFKRQIAGGSQSIRQGWTSLREAGATARAMLLEAAAKKWGVDINTLTTSNSYVINGNGNKIAYGDLIDIVSEITVPSKVVLKDPKDFKIIGQSKLNVDAKDIVTGKPLFGIDTQLEGMVYVRIARPIGFGTQLISFDADKALSTSGVSDVVELDNKVAVVANSTWAAIQGLNALEINWSKPLTSEDSNVHQEKLRALVEKPSKKPRVNRGDVNQAFSTADTILERIYEAPFLPHNCLEPMNFFANVTNGKVELHGPIQTPANTRKAVAKLLNRKESEITVGLSRMGGGFGRRLYGDFVLEAAEVSDKIRKPVQLIYTREDDMTAGVYRPASTYRFKASIKNGEITGYHVTGAGVRMRNTVRPGTWPQGSFPNFKLETHSLDSKITTGAWRAPTSNFLAFAEQVFIDELAETAKKDPLEFRLETLNQAIENPYGNLRYDPVKMKGVLQLVAKKSNWYQKEEGVFKGISTYYSHNTYVAEVAEITIVKNKPRIKRIVVASDCGIIINKSGAINQAVGGVVDGIGHAMYGELTFENGVPTSNNFDSYRLIRNNESPKVEAYFVESNEAPTGLGEPTLPPAAAALANAIYAGLGKRLYKQPFSKQGIALL